jgi:hypothetical protein
MLLPVPRAESLIVQPQTALPNGLRVPNMGLPSLSNSSFCPIPKVCESARTSNVVPDGENSNFLE